MRAILLILILAVVALIAAIGTGFLNITQTRGAKAPDVDATGNGVVAQGGQAPAFDVETGSVSLGTRDANVKVPSVQVNPAEQQGQQQPGQNQAAPATNTPM
jgi:hypothetical protein